MIKLVKINIKKKIPNELWRTLVKGKKMLVIFSRRFWLTTTKKKKRKKEVKVNYNRIEARLDKRRRRKKRRRERLAGSETQCEKGAKLSFAIKPSFLSHFLSKLERLVFGGPGEKATGPHQYSILSSF